MRDLVETVIAQVMKEPYGSESSATRDRASTAHNVKNYASAAPAFDSSEIKDKQLWDVCCKFEAIFMQQMMSAMRKSVPKSEFLPHGFAESMHDSMLDQAIADSGSKKGSLGIAKQMYRQMERSETGSREAIQGIQQATDNVGMTIDHNVMGGENGSY